MNSQVLRGSEQKVDNRHFIQSQKESNRMTEHSSRKTYIFNLKTNGASRTSQSIGYLQVLLYFVTVKRFHTHRRTVGNLVNCH